MQAIIYDSTGRILRRVTAPEDMLVIQKRDGEFLLIGDADDRTQYVDQGEVLDRPTMPVTLDKLECIANGLDTITVSGIPVGAQLTLGDIQQEATQSTASITFDVPGAFSFALELFPYLPFKATLNAT